MGAWAFLPGVVIAAGLLTFGRHRTRPDPSR
jgi:hypothetical protein